MDRDTKPHIHPLFPTLPNYRYHNPPRQAKKHFKIRKNTFKDRNLADSGKEKPYFFEDKKIKFKGL